MGVGGGVAGKVEHYCYLAISGMLDCGGVQKEQ